MASPGPKSPALKTNMDVDYVVSYRFSATGELQNSPPTANC